jgi:hypothetical protein
VPTTGAETPRTSLTTVQPSGSRLMSTASAGEISSPWRMMSRIASLRAPGRRMRRGICLRETRTMRIWRAKNRAIRSGSGLREPPPALLPALTPPARSTAKPRVRLPARNNVGGGESDSGMGRIVKAGRGQADFKWSILMTTLMTTLRTT